MSGNLPTDRPASPIMNNQNDISSSDFPDFLEIPDLGFCDPVLMEICQRTEFDESGNDMPVIKPEGYVEEMRPEVIQQDVQKTNNQLDIMEVEQNLDKLVIHHPNQHLTLNAINGRKDDSDFGMDDEFVLTGS
ncbi:hypothetical protein B9Z55_008763 [Caenorhabditis nigoni]|uniref:Uncharacterized protein n=2 Tax=Caenorhabditis nigoni TaxID=1611254 RepID=A0A2G5UP58_9PELO|nr:hypothetical protein B9Z55_008763 [Caenorhabditis nigoni]